MRLAGGIAVLLVSLGLAEGGAEPAAPAPDGAGALGQRLAAQIAACLPGPNGPAACVEAAQAPCTAWPAETPAPAILCYGAHKDGWRAATAETLAGMRARAPADLAAIIAIELKYDLLLALTQCDRLEDLARAVGTTPPVQVQRARARCEATAAGLGLARLMLRQDALP